MPTSAIRTFPANYRVEPYIDPHLASHRSVQLPADVSYAKGQVLGELTGNDEVQTITVTGTPTGGTLTITFGGQTTAAIAYNAAAAAVQAALQALSTIGTDNVSVSGGPGPGTPWVVTFKNALGSTNVAAMTTTDSLTGGTAPASAVTTTTAGAAGTPGTYTAYDSAGTNGSQTPKAVLMYATETDSAGKATYISSELGESYDSAPTWHTGFFATADLVGLTAAGLAAAGWTLISGTIGNGIVKIG